MFYMNQNVQMQKVETATKFNVELPVPCNIHISL